MYASYSFRSLSHASYGLYWYWVGHHACLASRKERRQSHRCLCPHHRPVSTQAAWEATNAAANAINARCRPMHPIYQRRHGYHRRKERKNRGRGSAGLKEKTMVAMGGGQGGVRWPCLRWSRRRAPEDEDALVKESAMEGDKDGGARMRTGMRSRRSSGPSPRWSLEAMCSAFGSPVVEKLAGELLRCHQLKCA
jgi:hypothetical protein